MFPHSNMAAGHVSENHPYLDAIKRQHAQQLIETMNIYQLKQVIQ